MLPKALRDELTAAGFDVDGDSIGLPEGADDDKIDDKIVELCSIAARHGMEPKSISAVTPQGMPVIIPLPNSRDRGPSA
jgi:hypothetical protein